MKEDRPLSTSYVKALHQVLVAHQSDIEVIDGQGRLSRLPLRKGDWKLIPNNPGDPRTLELVHEYSPPEEVAAEMDRLVAMHRAHDGVEAEISAAWLHHRFVQIHPFQDGNGRAARSLATLVLIQRGGFPFVVLRDDKNAYIDALRATDDGNLVPFVEFVCRLQKKALLQAIEHGAAALTGGAAIPSILEAVRDRLKAERLDENSVLLGAAELLRAKARERMQSLAEQVTEALPRSPLTGAWSYDGNPMHVPINGLPQATKRAADAASQADDWMNALLVISHGRHAVIRVSFDRFGDQSGAIMAASASVILFDRGGQCVGPAEPCAREPFTFTAGRDLSEVETAFDAWLEQSLTLGLEIWRRSL